MGAPDPGSFRDPLSRVFVEPDRVLRGLSVQGLAEFEAVAASPFFADLQRDGLIVDSRRLAPDDRPLGDDWAGVLEHPRLPLISYPYEWSFAMLRDAALLQLEITRRAVEGGCTTKDASSYNVQFDGAAPVFIDIGSFEPMRDGEPWPGYGQFCQLFLNPLVVQAVTGVAFHPWLRGSVGGITAADTAALVKGRARLQKGLLVHVKLQGRVERHRSESSGDVRGELRQAGFGPKVVLSQLKGLDAAVRALKGDEGSSEWSDYSDRSHYAAADLAAKDAQVVAAVAAGPPELVIDLGANDGRFSKLALEHGAARVVAVDSDHLVVDRLYRDLRASGERRILPLVLDLADPSPGLGWRGRERPSFVERMRPDLVLCLAVVHHLALTNTVPFDEIVAFLADFDAPVLVELPHRDDPMVELLLSRKRSGVFDHYSRSNWEQALEARFVVEERHELPSGTRTLYRCRIRAGDA